MSGNMNPGDFTRAQEALVEKIAFRAINEVGKEQRRQIDELRDGLGAKIDDLASRADEHMDAKIVKHAATCSVRKTVDEYVNQIRGGVRVGRAVWVLVVVVAGCAATLVTLATKLVMAAQGR